MPVLLDSHQGLRADGLTVGLVNNMPDTALEATERQFTALIAAAAGDRPVRLRLYALPGIPRSRQTMDSMAGRYAGTETLGRTPLDALIVTGCEPRAASLKDEPFWADLTAVIDWASTNTVSTLWSCLAAHAAVLHLDGIARHRLPTKRSGLFTCEAAAAHPLLDDMPHRIVVPHSRWNDLPEADLAAHGYAVLTRSSQAGVDLFVTQRDSLFVFVQGHPEYDLESIAKEYRRDLHRYLRGERADYPALPQNYFSLETEAAFLDIEARALTVRSAVGLRDLPRAIAFRPGVAEAWQASVIPLFRNWLAFVGSAQQQGREAA